MSAVVTSIYTLTDPRTNEVRYIGKTVRPLARRLSVHLALCQTEHNYRASWIRQLLALGLKPAIALIETVTGDGWAARERYWISEYRRQGARLTNLTDGGEGAAGYHHAPELVARLAEQRRGTKMSAEACARMSAGRKGRTLPAETKAKLSAALRGRKMPPESVARGAAARRGRVVSEETRAKLSRALKGRTVSPELIEAMAAINRGRKQSPQHVAARAGARRGSKLSDETKAKIRATCLTLLPTPRALNADQVREIRRRHAAGGVSYAELGRDYVVTKQTIRFVVLRISWKHVD